MNGFSAQQNAVLAGIATGTATGAVYGEQTAAQTSMEQLCNRLSVVLNEASQINARLTVVEQRLTGGCPIKQAGGNDTPRPVPNGHIMSLNMGFDELMSRLDAGSQIISRLQDVI